MTMVRMLDDGSLEFPTLDEALRAQLRWRALQEMPMTPKSAPVHETLDGVLTGIAVASGRLAGLEFRYEELLYDDREKWRRRALERAPAE